MPYLSKELDGESMNALLSRYRKSPLAGAPTLLPGVLLLFLIILACAIGPLFVDSANTKVMFGVPNSPPSANHLLGTQSEGRDMLALMIYATPATLAIGLIASGFGLLIGIILGMISGYFGKLTDAVISSTVDIILTIPPLVILILIAASFRVVTIWMMGLIIAITAWMYPTRVIRSQVLSMRERGFVKLAQLSNVGDLSIIFRELLPNLIPFMAAIFVNMVSTAILISIGLEVLGLGPQTTQTLGTILYYAITYTAIWNGWWWWWLPPIIVLMAIFLSLFLISIALDNFANPRLGRA